MDKWKHVSVLWPADSMWARKSKSSFRTGRYRVSGRDCRDQRVIDEFKCIYSFFCVWIIHANHADVYHMWGILQVEYSFSRCQQLMVQTKENKMMDGACAKNCQQAQKDRLCMITARQMLFYCRDKALFPSLAAIRVLQFETWDSRCRNNTITSWETLSNDKWTHTFCVVAPSYLCPLLFSQFHLPVDEFLPSAGLLLQPFLQVLSSFPLLIQSLVSHLHLLLLRNNGNVATK